MKTEDLKALGLTEEQIKAVMAENGKDIERERQKAEKAEGERDNYKSQLDTANETLKTFDGMNAADIKAKMAEYETTIKNMDDAYKKQIEERDFAQQLEKEIGAYKFTSELAKKAVMEEIKAAGLKLSDGKILGFSDKMAALKEQHQDAFASEKPKPEFSTGIKTPPDGEKAQLNEIRKVMGLKPVME